ncbi:response regulator [Cohnella rhizosphaerae]|uniref:response regulator n=1 Tax=Cohnella rhizosphaerae TaxID=1457232 RepID=UPI0030B8F29F
MKPIRLLLVEDDPDWVKSMSVYLNREEDLLVVGTASTPEEALRLAASIEFDVALLDVHLTEAGRDGIFTALALAELRPVRIVMLTSDASERTMTDAFAAGALHYLDKSRFKELPPGDSRRLPSSRGDGGTFEGAEAASAGGAAAAADRRRAGGVRAAGGRLHACADRAQAVQVREHAQKPGEQNSQKNSARAAGARRSTRFGRAVSTTISPNREKKRANRARASGLYPEEKEMLK